MIDRFGSIRPFTNIVKSEETHIGLLAPLFEKYGFDLPEDIQSVFERLKAASENHLGSFSNGLMRYP